MSRRIKRYIDVAIFIFSIVLLAGFVCHIDSVPLLLFADIERYEKELMELEDEAGRIKAQIISLESEIEYFKSLLEQNRIRARDIEREIQDIIKVLFYINIEKKINNILVKDIEIKSIRYGEYINCIITKYKKDLLDLQKLNEEYEAYISESNRRLNRYMQIQKELNEKIANIIRIIEMKGKAFVEAPVEEKKRILNQREESVRKIDEVARGAEESKDAEIEADKKFKIIWPVRQGDVIREFGTYYDQITKLEKFSKGIVIRAPFLSEVYAVADGQVIFSGWLKGFGNTIIIEHSYGFLSVYSHLARAECKKGDKVSERDIIGFVGDTGSSEGVVLYFELRKKGRAVDPLIYTK